MKPIYFKERNVVYAKDQSEYQPLPAFKDEQQTISCWQLTWKERFKLFLSGRIWLKQLNFGKPLQPQLPSTDNPFK